MVDGCSAMVIDGREHEAMFEKVLLMLDWTKAQRND